MQSNQKKNSRSDPYKDYDDFLEDNMSVEKYAKQVKTNPLLNPDLVTIEEINNIKQGMVNSFRHPINISKTAALLNGMERDIKYTDSINDDLLFSQLRDDEKTVKKSFVLHNFDKKSVYYDRLYKWIIFKDITELMMAPIPYLSKSDVAPLLLSNTKANRPKLYDLQLRIARPGVSHINVMELVNGCEEHMSGQLVKLIVRGDRLVFVFEWGREKSFMFFMYFKVIAPSWTKTEYDPACVLNLHRTDLFIEHSIQNENNSDSGDECDTNYGGGGDDEVDNADDELGMDFFGSNVITSKNKKCKSSFFEALEKKEEKSALDTFVSFYNEKINVSFIEKLKSDHIAYLNYGYIRVID